MTTGMATLNEDHLYVDEAGKVIDNLIAVDWRETPEEVVDSISDALEEHGLKIVEYLDKDGDGFCLFSLVKITK